ncbi:unnamed protein product [Prorocentrum cordatum]|uniref:DUS-like FMN-binding domain-containing protein n=1 Tax=Prorocentrum cordatum TaxID=2364126 RepID=A0ABN9RR48_9DINO|nr:unnamed protein product [Polarella glacialis]
MVVVLLLKSVEHGFHTCPGDRPLAAHFCGNDPEVLLAAAKHVADRVDAEHQSLGCALRRNAADPGGDAGAAGRVAGVPGTPRRRQSARIAWTQAWGPLGCCELDAQARRAAGQRAPPRGHCAAGGARSNRSALEASYLSLSAPCMPSRPSWRNPYLQKRHLLVRQAPAPEDRPLLLSIVKRLADGLAVPVFCKVRLLDTPDATVRLVRQLEASGAALIAVHARYRGTPTHRRDGPAHLDQVPALKRAVRVPVLANGNVRSWSDVVANLESTGADGVMSAEGMLDDPCLFAPGGGSSPSSAGLGGAAQLRKLEKKLRQVEALMQKAAAGGTLSKEEAEKVGSRRELRRQRRALRGGGDPAAQEGGRSAEPPARAGGRAVPSDGLQKARLYLEMCARHQMPILPTVLFHIRRMAKSELTQYQLLDEFKASSDLGAAQKVLALAEGYRDRPGTFVYDEDKARRARELLEKRAYEEACRRKYEQRMERKANKMGVPLASLLKPTKVPGGQLKGAPDPSWLQENEATAE